jgi:hypothetical protein
VPPPSSSTGTASIADIDSRRTIPSKWWVIVGAAT